MILITGASGFIGGVLSDYLEQEGLKIRRASKKKLNKKYLQLDLKNSNEIEAAISALHAERIVSESGRWEIPQDNYQN